MSRGDTVLGLAGLALGLGCDGGVDPDENFELKLDIHEFRRPTGLASAFREATMDGDVVTSSDFSTDGCFASTGVVSFFGVCFSSDVTGGEGGVERDGVLFERDLRCDFDLEVADSGSVRGLSPDDTDFVRDK